ncbi:MAG: hypothetical protein K0Q60_4834 [Microvirga sp.]|nr:hypothetical protein [Microvirga sp.]
MPLFMAQFAYTPQAWTALIHAPQDRAAASDALLRHFGGRLIGLYYTPGAEYDGFALFEAPDDAAAAAAARALGRGDACGASAGGLGAEYCPEARRLIYELDRLGLSRRPKIISAGHTFLGPSARAMRSRLRKMTCRASHALPKPASRNVRS